MSGRRRRRSMAAVHGRRGVGDGLKPSRAGWIAFAAACLLAFAPLPAAAAEPYLTGYSDYPQYMERIAKLGRAPGVKVYSLGKTKGDREILVVSLGEQPKGPQPAILVVGQVAAEHPVGAELCLRMAERLAEQPDDAGAKKLLERCKVYFLPLPSPDLLQGLVQAPVAERAGNLRPTDDDRDFSIGEDPPQDLDQNGVITAMRVEDPTGEWAPHPDDPRLMLKADPAKGEAGKWKVYAREGVDDDHDEKWNEDSSEGVAFNRNFTFKYPYFQKSAGPNAVSELESQAVADFVFSHTEIAAIYTFSPEDDLFHPWKPNPGAEGQRIKTTIRSADAPYMDLLAERYRKLHGGEDCPPSPAGQGSFTEWAYFHAGRWSFSARGWWIPKTPAPKVEADKADAKPATDKPKDGEAKSDAGNAQPDEAKPETAKQGEAKPDEGKAESKEKGDRDGGKPAAKGDEAKPEKDGGKKENGAKDKEKKDQKPNEELYALRWAKANDIAIFSDWKRVEHLDFPGRVVEVGGFRPFLRTNPPAEKLPSLADVHGKFLLEIASSLPRLEFAPPKVENLGGGVFRATLTAVNRGTLPTASEMSEIAQRTPALQMRLELPAGAKLLQGSGRRRLSVLRASGGSAEETWLIQLPPGSGPLTATATVWSPSVGQATVSVPLK